MKKKQTDNSKFYKELNRQIKGFANNDQFPDTHTPYGFDEDVYLVRFFRFFPPKSHQERHVKYVVANTDGPNHTKGDYIPQTELYSSVVYPAAKILKVGAFIKSNPDHFSRVYEEGDVVLIQPSKVVGELDNPDFRFWATTKEAAGMHVVTTPPPPKLPAIEVSYAQDQFIRFGATSVDEKDLDVYVLKASEVYGPFDVNKFCKVKEE